MKGYTGSITQILMGEHNFRHVLYTSKFLQLVVMTLKPGEEIGMEIHTVDQFFRFESGFGKAIIDGAQHTVRGGIVVIVPAGARHNIVNTSMDEPLKMYTLYAPPHHKDKIVHETKQYAVNDVEHFDGKTSE